MRRTAGPQDRRAHRRNDGQRSRLCHLGRRRRHHARLGCIGAAETPRGAHTLPRHRRIPQRSHHTFKTQRNPYDYAIQQTGLKVVEIDAAPASLRAAIKEATACVFWFPRGDCGSSELSLEAAIAIAAEQQVPVIVDAAAQLPPVENLWRFTEMGVAIALFSGGKDLRGPQSSGLMLGRRDFIDSIRPISNPKHGFGRPLKVGKEEMMGLLAAVERYLQLDHAARARYCEETVRMFCAALKPLPGVQAQRVSPNEAGQPLPWCRVSIDPAVLGRSADELVSAFLNHDPAIAVSPESETSFHLNPMTLESRRRNHRARRLPEDC